MGRLEEAVACYAKAVEIDPRDAAAWHNEGTVLNELGRHEEALACYEKALEIDSRYAASWADSRNVR